MNVDAYRLALSEGGKLKMRAVALLAEGGSVRTLDAAVLFHEAAHAEARSLLALTRVPAETRLAAAIEECWCLLEGGDPPAAALAWDRVRSASEQVTPDVAAAMRERLDPVYASRTHAYAIALADCETLGMMRLTGGLVPPSKSLRSRLEREVDGVLRDFPGIAGLWWAKYRLAEADGQVERAWNALSTACRLEPENATFAAAGLLLAASSRPVGEADQQLALAYESIASKEPEICLLYAFAEFELARRTGRGKTARWERALRAADAGLGQASRDVLRRHLLAARLLAKELLAGREVTVDILYRAGLGDLAAATLGGSDVDVVELLQRRARTEIEAEERLAA